jgi:hypothetical protein
MYYARRKTTVARNEAELLAAIPRGRRGYVLTEDEEVSNVRAAAPDLVVHEVRRAPYLVLQFRRLITREKPPTKDLVLLRVDRPA